MQNNNYGVKIGKYNFNCFCYADDILLCSVTVTGLQKLINIANEYVYDHGLRFNPAKTNCMIMGGNPFTTEPVWTIDNVPLNVSANIKYLGTEFGDLTGKEHCDSQIKASMKAYYSLQRSGIEHPEVDSHAVMDIYSSAIQCFSQYGCASVYMNKSCVSNLNKLQGKLIKRFLNLSLSCHTQPLLKCFNMGRTGNNIVIGTLDLLKKCTLSDSISQVLYCKLLSLKLSEIEYNRKTLVNRALDYANDYGIDINKYNFCDGYTSNIKRKLKEKYYTKEGLNGTTGIDSIRKLFNENKPDDIHFIELLLKSY